MAVVTRDEQRAVADDLAHLRVARADEGRATRRVVTDWWRMREDARDCAAALRGRS